MAKVVSGNDKGAVDATRSLLRSKVAELSEAECGEVVEYIEVMRSLSRDAADRKLFGDGFARRVSALCEGWRPPVQGVVR